MTWFMPSWGRPHRMLDLLNAKGGWPPEVIVQVNEDDPTLERYKALATPETPWRLEVVPAWMRCSDIHRLTYERYPHEEIYGFLMDDIWPITPHWWALLYRAAAPRYFAIPQGPGYPKSIRSAFAMGGDLVRAMGSVVPAMTRHWCEDCIWDDIANHCGLMRPVEKAIVDHRSYELQTAPNDATYIRNREFIENDRQAFDRWMKSPERLALFGRVNAMVKEAA
jgi:hypothetical protein